MSIYKHIYVARKALFLVLFIFNIFFVIAGFLLSRHADIVQDIGTYFVKMMYEFDDIEELPDRYKGIQKYIADSLWESLDFENESRVINTYYKFKASASQVYILSSSDGIVVYRLLNSALSAQNIWVFDYEVSNGLLSDVKEYKMVNVRRGRGGAW